MRLAIECFERAAIAAHALVRIRNVMLLNTFGCPIDDAGLGRGMTKMLYSILIFRISTSTQTKEVNEDIPKVKFSNFRKQHLLEFQG